MLWLSILQGVWIQWNGMVDWNAGMEQWNGLEHWNGMMEWWAETSNKLGSTIAVIGIVVAFTHGKRIHACVCTS